ncbi:MAG: hypothetical protein FE78DRAFT_27438 [Acidomyces sp. 'richmondensis']|nr:MAG: hypothetical protein FE78DRAFT_27438 [Acidomyces sp. 'richmondensis']
MFWPTTVQAGSRLLTSSVNVSPEATHDVLGENRANWVAMLDGIRTSIPSEASGADHALTTPLPMQLAAAQVSGAVITRGSGIVTAYMQPSGRVVFGEADLKLGQDIIVNGYTLRDRSSALEIFWTANHDLFGPGDANFNSSTSCTLARLRLTVKAPSALIFGMHTLAFDSIPTAAAHTHSDPIASAASTAMFKLASTTVTAVGQASGQAQIDGRILRPGQDMPIDSDTLRDVRTGVVLNGQTTTAFSIILPTSTSIGLLDAILTIGSGTFTIMPQPLGRVAINGDTLRPGQDIVCIRNSHEGVAGEGGDECCSYVRDIRSRFIDCQQ